MPYPHERILPIPTLDLKINLGGGFLLYDQTGHPGSLTESWLVGLHGVPHSIVWPREMRVYGVRFKPGGAYPFFGVPMSELHNRVLSLDVLWGAFASEMRERLYDAATIQAGLMLFEQMLRDRLCRKPQEQAVVEYGIATIARHHGTLSIRKLSDHIGISQNHLRTQFKRVVGSSVKELARLYRFEHVLRSVEPTQAVDWIRIAHQYGYYDQSHLNKDFVAFTGYSPTTYLHLRRRIYVEDAQVDRLSLRNLPTD
jgi:AraC-like DNA-binding protein